MSKPKNFILDVDGVMTTGHFLYSSEGKVFKIFGSHDYDGLKLLKKLINIEFITADKNGYNISKKRIVDDMGFSLRIVYEESRYEYCIKNYDIDTMIYMGDGLHDAKIIKDCYFGIAPINSRKESQEFADYVTPSKSGEGAVLDACLKVKELFFN